MPNAPAKEIDFRAAIRSGAIQQGSPAFDVAVASLYETERSAEARSAQQLIPNLGKESNGGKVVQDSQR